MRALCLSILAIGLSVPAHAADAPYYGPAKAWRGIGFKFGYKDVDQPDGTWRVDAISRSGNATEMALYRAAERAREEGYRYVEMLGGRGSSGPGMSFATLYARPTRTPAKPAACWKKTRPDGCYTADVAEVLRRLSGPDGTTPGVALASGVDKYGRQVSYGGVDFGFGVGAVSQVPSATASAGAAGAPQTAAVPASTVSATHPATTSARVVGANAGAVAMPGLTPAALPNTTPAPQPIGLARAAPLRTPATGDQRAADRFAAALREVQPVRRDARGAWTIGD